jgi:hypothetical protein
MAFRDSCPTLKQVGPDEPIFVLRAKDQLAPRILGYWIQLARAAGTPQEKLDEAERCQDAMMLWGRENGIKVPD